MRATMTVRNISSQNKDSMKEVYKCKICLQQYPRITRVKLHVEVVHMKVYQVINCLSLVCTYLNMELEFFVLIESIFF